MGEKVQVGTLIYTIVDTEWIDQLGDAAAGRIPKQRFLAIRMSVTNSGVRPSAIPRLELVDANGKSHFEENDAHGLSDWLGSLRMLEASQTEHGRVLFDVPTGAYKLRLADDADLDEQRTAIVSIPFQPPAQVPRPEPSLPVER